MKGHMILLDQLHTREAAALFRDGRLEDLLIDDDSRPRAGAIFRAICDRPLKGQGGMMLRLPDGDTGFLRQSKGLRPGQAILVQVTGYAEDGKAVPVTDRILFKSRYAIVTPGAPGINISRQITDDENRVRISEIAHDMMTDAPYGLICRSSCADADDDDIAEDIAAMRDLAHTILADTDGDTPEVLTQGDGPHLIAWREWTMPAQVVTEAGCFDTHGALDAIGALQSGVIPIEQGSMIVEPTRACVAVDVNTGKDTSPAAALKANLAAARTLPRALKLRGLGGQIVIDFAPMSKAHRKQLEQSLQASFKNNGIETALVGWTTMGLYEMQRKKERLPLHDIIKDL